MPLELAHLPYRDGRTYEDYVGLRGFVAPGPQEVDAPRRTGRGAAEARAAGRLRGAGRRPDQEAQDAAARRAPGHQRSTPSSAASASGTSRAQRQPRAGSPVVAVPREPAPVRAPDVAAEARGRPAPEPAMTTRLSWSATAPRSSPPRTASRAPWASTSPTRAASRCSASPRACADETIAAVYCSPLSRTVETAAILAEPHGLTPIHRDGLREISHGRWEGLTRQEVEERFPRRVRGLGGRPLHLRARGRRVRRGRAGARAARDPRDRGRPTRASACWWSRTRPRCASCSRACWASTPAATATASTSPPPASTSSTSRTRCARASCSSTTSPTTRTSPAPEANL